MLLATCNVSSGYGGKQDRLILANARTLSIFMGLPKDINIQKYFKKIGETNSIKDQILLPSLSSTHTLVSEI